MLFLSIFLGFLKMFWAWEQETAGSNPAIPTKISTGNKTKREGTSLVKEMAPNEQNR